MTETEKILFYVGMDRKKSRRSDSAWTNLCSQELKKMNILIINFDSYTTLTHVQNFKDFER